jgi:predicted nuclease with TOPRIM domain
MESTRLQSSTSEMTTLASQLSDRLQIVTSQQQQDIAAVQAQIARLEAILTNLNTQREQASKTLQDLIVQTTAIREETTDRRQDVMRLQNELEELRTDKFRLEQIRRALTDRLVRLQLENQALDQRMQQLQSLVNQTANN